MSCTLDGTITVSTATLDPVGVNSWRWVGCELAKTTFLTSIKIDVFKIEGMDVARDLIR